MRIPKVYTAWAVGVRAERREMPPGRLRLPAGYTAELRGLGWNAGQQGEHTAGVHKLMGWLACPECRTAEKTCGPRTHTAPEGEDTQAEHAEPPEYAADLCCRGRNAGKSSGTHCRGFIKSWTGFARPERRKSRGDVRPVVRKIMDWLRLSGMPDSREDMQPSDAHCPRR